jgi:hypothetical protein
MFVSGIPFKVDISLWEHCLPTWPITLQFRGLVWCTYGPTTAPASEADIRGVRPGAGYPSHLTHKSQCHRQKSFDFIMCKGLSIKKWYTKFVFVQRATWGIKVKSMLVWEYQQAVCAQCEIGIRYCVSGSLATVVFRIMKMKMPRLKSNWEVNSSILNQQSQRKDSSVGIPTG